MRRLRNRKGIFVVMFGILFMTLMGAAALSIDFSRIWEMRNELQTAADAASLAGAVQIGIAGKNSDVQVDSATKYFAGRNPAMGVATVVDSVVIGHWDDDPVGGGAQWTPLCRVVGSTCVTIGSPPSPLPKKNAVRTVVSHATSRLIMTGAFGVAAPTVRARSTAWADAPIAVDNCEKPWSIPYVILMAQLNQARGITPYNSSANVTRAFDQVADMAALNSMTVAQRTFSLKLGGGGGYDDPIPGSTAPGNYQAIKLPKYWDKATGQYYPQGNPGNGASDYQDNISGATCFPLAAGDSVEVKTGNMAGPTIKGVEDGICGIGQGGLPNNGDCLAADGSIGVPIKAAFHLCQVGCNGSARAEVKMLGSFTLMKVYPNKSGSNEKASIQGVFNPITNPGPVGGVGSTQVTIILVK